MTDTPAAQGKAIYACDQCGYSFYRDVADPAATPEQTLPCPQCGAPGAVFTFMLGPRCESADC